MTRYPMMLLLSLLPALALAACDRTHSPPSGNQSDNFAARAAELDAAAAKSASDEAAKLATEDATPPGNVAEPPPPLDNQEITPVDGR